jgi:hypothetical protein
MDSLPIDPATMHLLEARLHSGEAVRWSSAPVPSRIRVRLLPGFGIVFLFAMALVTVLAQGLFVGRMGDHSSDGTLYGIWFTLAAALCAGFLLYARSRTRRTAYAVTNRRAIVLVRVLLGPPSIRSFGPEALRGAEKVERSDGTGDVLLNTVQVSNRRGRPSQLTIGFYGVPDPGAAFERVRELAGRGEPDARDALKPRFRWFLLILPAIFGAVGLALASSGVRTVLKANESTGWTAARAVIVDSRVVMSGSGKHRSYSPYVWYGFFVGSTPRSGDTVCFGDVGGKGFAAKVVAEFPRGRAVTIRYDPMDPSRNVLMPGIYPWSFVGLLVGGFFATLGVSFFGLITQSDWPRRDR